MLNDTHGRTMRYLRVSLTDECNFHCGFCRPGKHARGTPDPDRPPLSPEERLRLCAIFARLGVASFKVTGGEPFMSPHALPTLERLKADNPAASVTVTTNGSTLDRHAESLAAIGVDGVNVSLNAMTPESYRTITGGDFPVGRVLDNILLAKRAGLRVKLNMVPIRGVNDRDIPAFVAFALENGHSPRFIELMPIAHAREYKGLGLSEIVRAVEARFGEVESFPGRLGNGPAAYVSVKGYEAKIGFIAAVSREFCARCDRIRLTAGGFLKTCLHHRHGVDLALALREGWTDTELKHLITATVKDKPGGHCFAGSAADAAAAGEDPMYWIGG